MTITDYGRSKDFDTERNRIYNDFAKFQEKDLDEKVSRRNSDHRCRG